MAALRVVLGIGRLVGRLGGAGLGFLWARRRAARTFYRRLVRAGIPVDVARALAEDYRGPGLRELLKK